MKLRVRLKEMTNEERTVRKTAKRGLYDTEDGQSYQVNWLSQQGVW